MTSLEDIQEEFSDLDLEVTDEAVLIKLQQLCQMYNIGESLIEPFSSKVNNLTQLIQRDLIKKPIET